MRCRLLRAIAALALLVCFACPVSEMFDHWDHTLKTGKDTESSVMILAVCVGAVISFSLGELLLVVRSDAPEKRIFERPVMKLSFLLIVGAVAAVSQPPPPLRI